MRSVGVQRGRYTERVRLSRGAGALRGVRACGRSGALSACRRKTVVGSLLALLSRYNASVLRKRVLLPGCGDQEGLFYYGDGQDYIQAGGNPNPVERTRTYPYIRASLLKHLESYGKDDANPYVLVAGTNFGEL